MDDRARVKARGRYVCGLLALGAVVCLWVGSSLLIQCIFVGYTHPFFLTYFSTSLFSLYLLTFAARRHCAGRAPLEDEGIAHAQTATTALLGASPARPRSLSSDAALVDDRLFAPGAEAAAAMDHSPMSSDGGSGVGGGGGRSRGGGGGSAVTEEFAPLLVSASSADVGAAAAAPIALRHSAGGTAPAARVRGTHLVSVTPAAAAAATTAAEAHVAAGVAAVEVPARMSVRETLRVAAVLCPLWFALNYTFNISLSQTSLASSTVLSSTSGLWTLGLALVVLRERLLAVNVIGIACTIGGAVCVAWADAHSSDSDDGGNCDSAPSPSAHSFAGDLWCLASAVCYAVYTVALKAKIVDDDAVDMQLLFGCIGALNALFLWPLFPLLHLTRLEPFALPAARDLGLLLLNGLFGTVLSDLLWARAVLLTSPLVATLALSLTIPLSLLVDVAVNGRHLSGLYGGGGALVVAGFALVNWRAQQQQQQQQQQPPPLLHGESRGPEEEEPLEEPPPSPPPERTPAAAAAAKEEEEEQEEEQGEEESDAQPRAGRSPRRRRQLEA